MLIHGKIKCHQFNQIRQQIWWLTLCSHPFLRTELHLNHVAENDAFKIMPQTKVYTNFIYNFFDQRKKSNSLEHFFCNSNLRYVSLMRFGGFCCIHKEIYMLSVRLRRSSEPPSNFPNSKQPWRFWGSAVMNRRLSGSSSLRSTISVLREPPRVRLLIRRDFHSINNIPHTIK